MSIEQIKKDQIQAMKNKETAKLSTLRLLVSEIETEMKKTGATELSEDQLVDVVNRQIKKLNKEIESYVAVGRSTEKQDAEKQVLLAYLPEQLSENEIRNQVAYAVSLTISGQIRNPMQYLSKELKGKANMGLVMQMVKQLEK